MVSKAANERRYSFLPLVVDDFEIRASVAINPSAKDAKNSPPDTKIFQQYSSIELNCHNIDPGEPATDAFHFSIYGHAESLYKPDLSLADCHVLDDNGFKKYRKRRGIDEAIYEIPKGVAVLHKKYGAREWHSAIWQPPNIVSDMIPILLSDLNVYIACHIQHEGRVRWIMLFDLQTSDPTAE